MSENSCILKSVCKSNKRFDKTCRKAGIETLIRCAKERDDDSVLCGLDEVLSSNVEPNLELHKSCYCTYISKDKLEKLGKKRSKDAEELEAGPTGSLSIQDQWQTLQGFNTKHIASFAMKNVFRRT